MNEPTMPSDADVLRALVAKGEQVTPASLSPVFSLKTGWVIGRIADHTAHPLNTTDAMLATEYACDMLNSRPALARLLASHAALVARHARFEKIERAILANGGVNLWRKFDCDEDNPENIWHASVDARNGRAIFSRETWDDAVLAALDTVLAEEAKEPQ